MNPADLLVPAPMNWHPVNVASLVARLVAHMSANHTGATNGVHGADLARALGMEIRLMRKVISQAREQGTAISGRPETGYFIASDAAELEECCAFLRSRAMHSLRIESRLRQIPLPDLLGQLHLPT